MPYHYQFARRVHGKTWNVEVFGDDRGGEVKLSRGLVPHWDGRFFWHEYTEACSMAAGRVEVLRRAATAIALMRHGFCPRLSYPSRYNRKEYGRNLMIPAYREAA